MDLKSRVLDDRLTPFERLVLLMGILRSPEGCQWDRKQTHKSLLPYLLEEAYEVVEAVEAGVPERLAEELGDLMVQVVFHAQLARERGEFDIDDAINRVVDKLVARHPHVFADRRNLAPQEVRDQWEKIKTESGEKESVLGGLPRTMPALTAAFRLGEKAGGIGFDWKQPADVLAKIEEELGEIRAEMDRPDRSGKEALTGEIGDLLFAAASLARQLEIEPELALREALDKFRRRFGRLEARVRKSGRSFDEYTLEELEAIWQEIKPQVTGQ
jgi:tetrapyrrole methylase family protein/MazG family protein